MLNINPFRLKGRFSKIWSRGNKTMIHCCLITASWYNWVKLKWPSSRYVSSCSHFARTLWHKTRLPRAFCDSSQAISRMKCPSAFRYTKESAKVRLATFDWIDTGRSFRLALVKSSREICYTPYTMPVILTAFHWNLFVSHALIWNLLWHAFSYL